MIRKWRNQKETPTPAKNRSGNKLGHKRPYKARFIANSSSCTTTELSKLLTSCLTAIKSHVIRYCETVYETSNKNWFWSIKNSGEVLSKWVPCDKLVHV